MTTRVTGGALKGRRLQTPKGESVRPTSSRVRESIFSILSQRLEGLSVLDVCAGAGTLGIEAASRGARQVVFVERDARTARLLGENVRLLEGVAEHRVIKRPASQALAALAAAGERFDLVFADPPYAQAARIVAEIGGATSTLLAEGGTFIVEAASKASLPEELGSLRVLDRRSYGSTSVTMYGREEA